MKKCIITVVGKDKVGIIAGVCQYLSDISDKHIKYFPDNRRGLF